MAKKADRLYELLPVIYRKRDAEQGYPLKALLQVISEQVNLVEEDIDQLYGNWFIETCQDWVVPYIGDLIGYHPVHEAGEPGSLATPQGRLRNKILIPRREVANTVRYRRKKGTLALLELLGNDVAGWPARAVEFYERLGYCQSLKHLHLERGRTIDLRQGDALDRLNGPFDELAHTVDVRSVCSSSPGRYNIPSVGVFIWPVKPFSVTRAPACFPERMQRPNCYTFSILGEDTPLFTRPEPETEPTHIAEEMNLPVPIRRRAFKDNIAKYYGEDKSLQIWLDDLEHPVSRDRIVAADLSEWEYRPQKDQVAVDPEKGRIAFSPRQAPPKGVIVSYTYGFSKELGGGEYERRLTQPEGAAIYRVGKNAEHKSINSALRSWQKDREKKKEHVFGWKKVPGEDEEKLGGFLAKKFDINWLKNAKFEKIENGKAIEVSGERNSLSLKLNDENKKVILEIYGSRRYEFTSEMKDDEIEIYNKDEPKDAVIEIMDSDVYEPELEEEGEKKIHIELYEDQSLQIRAANGARPVIRLLDYYVSRQDYLTVTGQRGSRFTLDGLMITNQGIRIKGLEGGMSRVIIRHCTFVPGRAPLELVNLEGRLSIEQSILGRVMVNRDEVTGDPMLINISDSILDGVSAEEGESAEVMALDAPNELLAHAVLTVVRSTILGAIRAHAIDLGEDSIFQGPVVMGRSQRGCMRFCYVTPGSRTPRRFSCQPDLAIEAALAKLAADLSEQNPDANAEPDVEAMDAAAEQAVNETRPQFESTRYGTPGYCRLVSSLSEEIRRGAEDESEMGAFHDLYQPQREANLRVRLREFAPASMQAGIIYADHQLRRRS